MHWLPVFEDNQQVLARRQSFGNEKPIRLNANIDAAWAVERRNLEPPILGALQRANFPAKDGVGSALYAEFQLYSHVVPGET